MSRNVSPELVAISLPVNLLFGDFRESRSANVDIGVRQLSDLWHMLQ
jgi:hypothetical protein